MSDGGNPEFIARLDAERASRAAEALVARGEIDRRDLFEQVEATRRLTASPAEAREVLAHQIHARQAAENTERVRQQIQARAERIKLLEAREAARRERDADAAVQELLNSGAEFEPEMIDGFRRQFVAEPALINRVRRFLR